MLTDSLQGQKATMKVSLDPENQTPREKSPLPVPRRQKEKKLPNDHGDGSIGNGYGNMAVQEIIEWSEIYGEKMPLTSPSLLLYHIIFYVP